MTENLEDLSNLPSSTCPHESTQDQQDDGCGSLERAESYQKQRRKPNRLDDQAYYEAST